MKSYKDLDIYNLAFQYSIEVHHASLKMPKFELYEQGSQVRRSSKSVKDNIIEGYGRRSYKQDFIKFLTYSNASLLECKGQLETIQRLYDIPEVPELIIKYDDLGAKIFAFILYVEKNWKT
ncbi:four helix bundle protein [Aequorivita sp. CIP111184]|uniref:four helix bundle protein n=1 Tax=Aequorivita sp. CIP111184 TaxID=2211356 RepID=UPI000DD0A4BF|nr:four helix bundle protein [Aequorivita sp. CIP111184]